MTASDLFGVVVRSVGFLMLVLGIVGFVAHSILVAHPTHGAPEQGVMIFADVALVAIGVVFIVTAHWIVGIVYGNRPS